MALLGIDLGGTKLALAIFTEEGRIIDRQIIPLDNRRGKEVGRLITDRISYILNSAETKGNKIQSVGISVPGISHSATGTVWAPNIPGWDDYPLLQEVTTVCGKIPVIMDSDRAC
jgi:glucokinase